MSSPSIAPFLNAGPHSFQEIAHGFHSSPFGLCLLAATDEGICHLSFVDASKTSALNSLQRQWPKAQHHEQPDLTGPLLERIFQPNATPGLNLLVQGTPFQIQVWEVLLRIPFGHVMTYEEIATSIGAPGSSRAVGGAVGANRIAYLIPCHRVIRKNGSINSYRWGVLRKRELLEWEAKQRLDS